MSITDIVFMQVNEHRRINYGDMPVLIIMHPIKMIEWVDQESSVTNMVRDLVQFKKFMGIDIFRTVDIDVDKIIVR